MQKASVEILRNILRVAAQPFVVAIIVVVVVVVVSVVVAVVVVVFVVVVVAVTALGAAEEFLAEQTAQSKANKQTST